MPAAPPTSRDEPPSAEVFRCWPNFSADPGREPSKGDLRLLAFGEIRAVTFRLGGLLLENGANDFIWIWGSLAILCFEAHRTALGAISSPVDGAVQVSGRLGSPDFVETASDLLRRVESSELELVTMDKDLRSPVTN